MNTNLLASALACSIAMSASGANAADRFDNVEVAPSYPYIEGELIWELRGDFTTKSDDPDAELNDIYGYLEQGGSTFASESFKIKFAVIGEPVLDASNDRFFEFIGLGLNHSFDGGNAGTVTLGASVFFADTTALSESIGTRGGRKQLRDAGDEHNLVAGFAKETDLGDGRAEVFNIEFASIENYGESADDATYVTARLS